MHALHQRRQLVERVRRGRVVADVQDGAQAPELVAGGERVAPRGRVLRAGDLVQQQREHVVELGGDPAAFAGLGELRLELVLVLDGQLVQAVLLGRWRRRMRVISATSTAAPTTTMMIGEDHYSHSYTTTSGRGCRPHHLRRGHRVRVLLVEELETAPEARCLGHEVLVLGDLQRLRAEAVDVEHVGQLGRAP